MRSKMSAIGTSDSAFHDGNPSTGELGTIVTADWLNAVQASTMDVQDELLNVLSAGDVVEDEVVQNQVALAISNIADKRISNANNLAQFKGILVSGCFAIQKLN